MSDTRPTVMGTPDRRFAPGLTADAPTPRANDASAPDATDATGDSPGLATGQPDAAGVGPGGPATGRGAPSPAPEDVMAALATVFDPELNLSVVALGLIYDVSIAGTRVSITMTLTAPGCPLHEVMADWVGTAVQAVRGVEQVDVTVTFDPPWTPARIARS